MKKLSHAFLPGKDPVTSWHTNHNVLTNVCSNSWCFFPQIRFILPPTKAEACVAGPCSPQSGTLFLLQCMSDRCMALWAVRFLGTLLCLLLLAMASFQWHCMELSALMFLLLSWWHHPAGEGYGAIVFPLFPPKCHVFPDYLSLSSVWVVASFTLCHRHPQTGCAKF